MKTKAFTLIELIISLVILAIAVALLFELSSKWRSMGGANSVVVGTLVKFSTRDSVWVFEISKYRSKRYGAVDTLITFTTKEASVGNRVEALAGKQVKVRYVDGFGVLLRAVSVEEVSGTTPEAP